MTAMNRLFRPTRSKKTMPRIEPRRRGHSLLAGRSACARACPLVGEMPSETRIKSQIRSRIYAEVGARSDCARILRSAYRKGTINSGRSPVFAHHMRPPSTAQGQRKPQTKQETKQVRRFYLRDSSNLGGKTFADVGGSANRLAQSDLCLWKSLPETAIVQKRSQMVNKGGQRLANGSVRSHAK